jgi:cysteine synthase A
MTAAEAQERRTMDYSTSVIDQIGNTPLILLKRASEETGCRILGKAEFLNPGQSVKDRAALGIIRDAEASGALRPGGIIVEGTAGNTGIGLAMVGGALGYRTKIVVPRTQSQEKKTAVRLFGAELIEVDAVPYANPDNYVHYSRRLAEELAKTEPNGAIWANQFDNTANRDFHWKTTGPEIWDQTEGEVKERNTNIRCVVSDPMGSKIFSLIKFGKEETEGGSITEGIGQGRITANLEGAPIDDAYRIGDPEALEILFKLAVEEGLSLGGSSGINVAGAVRLARDMGPGHTIVTMLCDYGNRYASKLYNPEFLRSKGLPTPPWM